MRRFDCGRRRGRAVSGKLAARNFRRRTIGPVVAELVCVQPDPLHRARCEKQLMSASSPSAFVNVRGRSIEYRRIAAAVDSPTLVFLHEGLGSISQWRDFPARIAEETGLPAIAYARYGHGQSDMLQQPHGVDFMHREALESLPEFLCQLDIERPILIGHSDGASIAFIYAGAGHPLQGLVALAPHVFVEGISIDSITAAKRTFETTDLRKKLARHHRDPAKTFYGWNDVWLAPEFRN